jgi:pyrimidine operon attenuation protein / uracil phosphoribosyltransferase
VSPDLETRLLDADQVRRTVRRLAYQILERNRGSGNLTILGIRKRGAALGRSITRAIESIEGAAVPCHDLDVSAYRDDRQETEYPAPEDIDLSDRDVILVDDVLFTGRTARAALDAVVRFGRPRTIQLTVLVDRGHREYPIQPDFVGRSIPTKHQERVRVVLGSDPSVDIVE